MHNHEFMDPLTNPTQFNCSHENREIPILTIKKARNKVLTFPCSQRKTSRIRTFRTQKKMIPRPRNYATYFQQPTCCSWHEWKLHTFWIDLAWKWIVGPTSSLMIMHFPGCIKTLLLPSTILILVGVHCNTPIYTTALQQASILQYLHIFIQLKNL